jgi:hypothetical protein
MARGGGGDRCVARGLLDIALGLRDRRGGEEQRQPAGASREAAAREAVIDLEERDLLA